MAQTIGEVSEMWHRYGDFFELHHEYAKKLQELSQVKVDPQSGNAHIGKLVDDMIKECEIPAEIREKVAELRMKECHSIMIVGWEENQ